MTSGHSTAISSLQDSVGKNTQAITALNNGLSSTNATVAKIESNLETLEITVRNNSTAINTINTRTKGIVSNTAGTDGWYGITLDTDGNLNYRIAWCNSATKTMLSSSSRGSIYLFNQGISSLTGAVGWCQTSATAVEAWYNGLSNSNVTSINNQINTLENKTKGFSTVNDTVSGWFGFNLLVGSDNYRIGWSPSAPIETVTEASAPGSLYLTQTGLTGNTYGYSQTGTQEVKTLYNGSDTSSIENEIETLQTTVTEHTQQISALQDDVNNNVSDISDLQSNLSTASNTIKQIGNLANEINTRTKGISTKTDSSDNWFGINFSTNDSYTYRLAWSNQSPSATTLQTSCPGSLYLRIGGPSPDIWLYGWSQNGSDTNQQMYNASPHS